MMEEPKLNAYIQVKRVRDGVVMYIHPADVEMGIALSRFYLLNETKGKVELSSFGPASIDAEEKDTPVSCLMIDVIRKGEKKKLDEYFPAE